MSVLRRNTFVLNSLIAIVALCTVLKETEGLNIPANATVESSPASVVAPLTVVDDVALYLINGFRITHQAPAATYSTTLKQLAQNCANAFVAANPNVVLPFAYPSCIGAATAGLTMGYNSEVNSNGARAAIADPIAGWFSQYVNNQGSFPPQAVASYNPVYQDYTQMIWVASNQVGCAFSSTPVQLNDNVNPILAQYIYMCLWTPAGNVPATFPDNVLADI